MDHELNELVSTFYGMYHAFPYINGVSDSVESAYVRLWNANEIHNKRRNEVTFLKYLCIPQFQHQHSQPTIEFSRN